MTGYNDESGREINDPQIYFHILQGFSPIFDSSWEAES